MGCNCGGGTRAAVSRAPREAARVSAGSPLGFSPDEPHVLGESGGDVRRVRVMRSTDGLVTGQAAFVTGSKVDELIASGHLYDITRTMQKKRLFKVNGFTYTSEREANRVAATLGVKPIEVA